MLATYLKTVVPSRGDNLVFAGGFSANASSASPSFSLTSLTGGVATRPASGDFIVACIAVSGAADRTFSASGYTKVADLLANGTTYDSQLAVFYKVADGTETGVSFSGLGTLQPSWFCVHVWRGVNATTPLDATSVTNTLTGTGRPNASAITTVTANSVVLAIGSEASDTSSVLTAPTGMTNKFDYTSSGSGVVIASVKVTSAGTYDPAVFGGGATNSAASACAVTMALRSS